MKNNFFLSNVYFIIIIIPNVVHSSNALEYKQQFNSLSFEVLMAVKMTTFFWVVMQCELSGSANVETYNVSIFRTKDGDNMLPVKFIILRTSLHSVTAQKNFIINSLTFYKQ